MEFHRIPAEHLRNNIFKLMFDKGFIKEGVTMEQLKESIPFDDNDNIASNSNDEDDNIQVVKTEVFSDNIQDDSDDEDNSSKTPSPKVVKKEKKEKKQKKEKKEKSDKPSKPAPSFAYFKSHPDNIATIEEEASIINEETGKPFGKVKGAANIWKKLSDSEKNSWAEKSRIAFEESQKNTD